MHDFTLLRARTTFTLHAPAVVAVVLEDRLARVQERLSPIVLTALLVAFSRGIAVVRILEVGDVHTWLVVRQVTHLQRDPQTGLRASIPSDHETCPSFPVV